jgi:hypothetical protein
VATLELMSRPTKPPTGTVRMASDVARDCRIIAAALGVSLPDFLTETLRPITQAKLAELFSPADHRRKPKPKA